MTTQQISEHLLAVFTSLGLSAKAITDQAHFTHDLGLDSLDVTDLLLQVEMTFGIRIPDEDWWMLQTVGAVKTYLASQLIVGGALSA